jgi:predicted RND superfamily exporter protein
VIADQHSPLIHRYVHFIIRWRMSVILSLAVISIYFASHIPSLKVNVDTPRFLPQDHPYVVAQNELEQTFGGRDIVAIGVFPRAGDIYRPSVLAKVARITEKIDSLSGVIRSNVMSLSARRAKAIRGTDDGMEIRPLFSDPKDLEAIARLRDDLKASPLFWNTVVSPDGRAAQIIADFKLGGEIPDYAALERAVRAVAEAEQDHETEIAVGGLPIALSWLSAYSERIKWIFPLTVLIIGLLHFHAFRTLQGFFIPLLTALLAVVWALGIMGLLRVQIDPFSAATPILVLAVAAGHSVQILKRYYEEFHRCRDNHEAVIESTARIGAVMVLAGVISAAGFFSLMVFKTHVIRTFGLYTGIGILSALIIEMTLIPAIRAAMPAPREREQLRERVRGFLDVALERLAAVLIQANPRPILFGACLLIGLAAFGVAQVYVDNGMKRWYFAGTQLIREDRLLNASFGGTNTLNFLIEGPAPDTMKEPRALEAIDRLQRFLESVTGVGKTLSFVDYVKQMNRAAHADDPKFYSVPPSRELIAQYLLLYSIGGDPGDFDAYVDYDYRRANLHVFCRTDSTAFTRELLTRVEQFVRENFPPDIRVRPAGTMSYTLALNETMAHGKVQNILQIIAIIFLLSSLLFRSVVAGVFVIVPLAITVIVNFALLGFSRTPLDIPTAAIMAVAVGLGADFSIYFLMRFREELGRALDASKAMFATMTTSGKAIVYVSTAVSLGYLTLTLSGFGIHMRTALLMGSAIVVSCLSTLVLLPPLLLLTRPRFSFSVIAEISLVTEEQPKIAQLS